MVYIHEYKTGKVLRNEEPGDGLPVLTLEGVGCCQNYLTVE